MKKYKNTLVATLLTVLALLSFTSCVEESYWNRGELNFTTVEDKEPPYTNNRGEFDISIDFYDTNIIGYDPHLDYLEDFRMYNTWLSIFNKKTLWKGNQIKVYLEAKGVGTYSTILYVDRNGEGYIDGGMDPNLLIFMHNFINKVLYGGQARLHIYGAVYNSAGRPVSQSIPFDISLENSLELLIRDRHR